MVTHVIPGPSDVHDVPTGDDVGVKVPPVFLPPDDFLDLLVGFLQEEGGQGSLRFENQFDLHQG